MILNVRVDLNNDGTYDTNIEALQPDEDASFIAACTVLHAAAKHSRFGFDAFVGNVLRRVNDMKAAETEDSNGSTERELPGGQEQPSPVQQSKHDDGQLDGIVHGD